MPPLLFCFPLTTLPSPSALLIRLVDVSRDLTVRFFFFIFSPRFLESREVSLVTLAALLVPPSSPPPDRPELDPPRSFPHLPAVFRAHPCSGRSLRLRARRLTPRTQACAQRRIAPPSRLGTVPLNIRRSPWPLSPERQRVRRHPNEAALRLLSLQYRMHRFFLLLFFLLGFLLVVPHQDRHTHPPLPRPKRPFLTCPVVQARANVPSRSSLLSLLPAFSPTARSFPLLVHLCPSAPPRAPHPDPSLRYVFGVVAPLFPSYSFFLSFFLSISLFS